MHAYLHCLSHSPLVGYVDPAQEVLDEVNGVIASARERIAAFSPELVVLFAPDHYNGFFYDVMPPFCLGVGATAIGISAVRRESYPCLWSWRRLVRMP